MKRMSKNDSDNYKVLCEIRYQLHEALKATIKEDNFTFLHEALRILDDHIFTEYKSGSTQKYDTCDKQLT